jgi:hypothetical protein
MKTLSSQARRLLLLVSAALPLLAQAQAPVVQMPPQTDTQPQATVQAQPAEEAQPAVQTQPVPAPRAAARHSAAPAAGTGVAEGSDDTPGTTLIGDRESPLGLYLTPWKNEYAERGMDRPPQNLQETVAPVDPKVLDRQRDYYDTIVNYRQAETGGQK